MMLIWLGQMPLPLFLLPSLSMPPYLPLVLGQLDQQYREQSKRFTQFIFS
nr:hypothetical protein Q903MT_gene1848 [Picea sitchensis]